VRGKAETQIVAACCASDETMLAGVEFLGQPRPSEYSAGPCRRDVAQPGRALAWGARGRQFKSARPDQHFSDPSLRSGFRLRAPASLTPANRLKFRSARPDQCF
jgi:hypothetical protein